MHYISCTGSTLLRYSNSVTKPLLIKNIRGKCNYINTALYSQILIVAAYSSLILTPTVLGDKNTKLQSMNDDQTNNNTIEKGDTNELQLNSAYNWISSVGDNVKAYFSNIEAKFYNDLKSLNEQLGISSDGLSNLAKFFSSNLNSFSKGSSSVQSGNWDDFINLIGFSSMSSSESGYSTSSNSFDDVPPECDMSTAQIIEHNGFPCEEHQSVTKDGYILSLHRIPYGRNLNETLKAESKPVVFFQHGLLADSSCWVSNGPDNSLPYILADAGCDVWLGNVRGNSYSRTHKTLDASSDQNFWNFTWQDMAEYDLPSMIDYVLAISGQKQLYYVGHSQGTLVAFARLAEDVEFNKKVKMFFALAPIAILADITSPIRSLTPLAIIAQTGLDMFGGAEILPKKPIARWISAKVHRLHKMYENNALGPGGKLVYEGNNLLMYLCGVRTESYFKDRMPIYFTHTPSGTSLHNLVHFSQLVTSGKTQKWDYGSPFKNKEKYGQEIPPEYNLSKIEAPVALYVGSEDQLADLSDVKKLTQKLKTVFRYRILQDFDHLDFLWGKRSPTVIYSEISNIIRQYESTSDLHAVSSDADINNIVKDEL